MMMKAPKMITIIKSVTKIKKNYFVNNFFYFYSYSKQFKINNLKWNQNITTLG